MSDSVLTLDDGADDVAFDASAILPGAYYWALPVDGAFDESGAWLLNGLATSAVPTAADTVVFATGSATPYTVSGAVVAYDIIIEGDDVTFSGSLTATDNISWTSSSPIDLPGIPITAGGAISLNAPSLTGLVDVTEPATAAEPTATNITVAPATGAVILNGATLTEADLTALAANIAVGSGSAGAPSVSAASATLPVTDNSASQVLLQPSAGVPLASASNETLVGAAAGDTLFGLASGNTMLTGGPGTETLVGNGGATTLVGGGSGDVMFGGSGDTEMFGAPGGGDAMVGGIGTTMMQLQPGDIAFGGSGDTEEFASASGASTMVGGQGSAAMVGAGGSAVFVGATGTATVWAGAGSSTVFAGSGQMLVAGGSGASDILFGAGDATVFAGAGADLFTFTEGSGGGQAVIADFNAATDRIALYGYDVAAVQAQAAAGATQFTLADGTGITLVGVTHLDPGSIV